MIKTLLGSMRVPFLILSPVCVFLAAATAFSETGQLEIFRTSLALVGALAAHISVNTFNEYLDFRSGLDANTIKTPFSGGSGALIANPDAANSVFALAMGSLILTCLIGGYFAIQLGWTIIPLGLLGILLIVTYTQWINRHPLLCLIAPGLAFGPVMVIGSYWVFVGSYSLLSIWVALIPFFLTNNLLLLNQLPDIEADKQSGRWHAPIAYGGKASIYLYALFIFAALSCLLLGVFVQVLPPLCLIAVLTLLPSIIVIKGVSQSVTLPKHERAKALTPYLGINVAITLLTPCLTAIAILIA